MCVVDVGGVPAIHHPAPPHTPIPLIPTAVGMIFGPQAVEPHEREKAGFIMTLALQGGILIGSQCAFGFTGGPST